VKYHYFYRFFTYSVKRSRGRKALVSGVEAHERSRQGAGPTVASVGVVRSRGRAASFRRGAFRAGHRHGRARSALKTVSGGEFDWGGTSVKR
jgi:hypothetical protein